MLLAASVIYLGIGVFLLFNGVLLVVGIVFILSFGWSARLSFLRLTGSIPALVIDSDGMEDNSSWASVGRVKWSEINEIKTKRVLFFYKFIRVSLKNPSAVIEREQNPFKRMGIWWRTLFQRTPMQFNTRLMGISYNELAKILQDINLDNPGFSDLSKHLID